MPHWNPIAFIYAPYGSSIKPDKLFWFFSLAIYPSHASSIVFENAINKPKYKNIIFWFDKPKNISVNIPKKA